MAFLYPLAAAISVGSVGYSVAKTVNVKGDEQGVFSNGNYLSYYPDPTNTIMDPHTIGYRDNLFVIDQDVGPYGVPRTYYKDPAGTSSQIRTYDRPTYNSLTKL